MATGAARTAGSRAPIPDADRRCVGGTPHPAWLETAHVGAEGEEFALTFLERCLLAGRALWFYAAKLVWPHPLVFIYPRWHIDAGILWQWAYSDSGTRGSGRPLEPARAPQPVSVCRRRILRDDACARAWVLQRLPNALLFRRRPFSVSREHRAHRARYRRDGAGSRQSPDFSTSTRTAFCAAILLVLGGLTFRQALVYRDAETLWRATIEHNPSAWIAYNNLGIILDDQEREEEAVTMYSEALRLKPDFVESHNNVSVSLVGLGRLEEARQHMLEAIRLRPLYQPFYISLAMILERQGKIDDAVATYRKLIDTWPWYEEARVNLVSLLLEHGRSDEAAALQRASE